MNISPDMRLVSKLKAEYAGNSDLRLPPRTQKIASKLSKGLESVAFH